MGRTVTAIDTASGHLRATLYGGYKIDHILLAPNGKEMWGTSNAEGRLHVYDVESNELIKKIDMPGNGRAETVEADPSTPLVHAIRPGLCEHAT